MYIIVNAVSIKKSPDNLINKLDYDSQYAMPKLNIVRSTNLMPRPTLLSETTPIKSYDFPSQKINTRRVDSKSEAKSENKSGMLLSFTVRTLRIHYIFRSVEQ